MATHDERASYAESMAQYWESVGFARAAGQLIGHLMVCDPPHQTQAELAAALGLSAGTISVQIRNLVSLGLAESVRLPGERARYYQMPQGAWGLVMRAEGERIAALGAMAEAGLGVLPPTREDRITDLDAMTRFFEAEWPALVKRFEDFLRKDTA